MKPVKTYLAIVMAMLLFSCHNNSGKENVDSTALQDMSAVGVQKLDENKAKEALPPDGNITAADTSIVVFQAGNPAPSIDWDKKIIKDASIRLQLKDYDAFDKYLHNNVRRYGAYIAEEQQTGSESSIENTISIKVPVDRFEELLNALPVSGAKVLEKRISTQDVTGEVVDTKARIEAKKQVRDRYYALLKQANKMKDILDVQNEINSIQEDIEAGSGRVSLLQHQASYSTIHITYFQYLDGNDGSTNTPSFFTKIKDAFATGSSIVSGFILLMVTFWPFLLATCIVWLIIKKRKLIIRQALNKV